MIKFSFFSPSFSSIKSNPFSFFVATLGIVLGLVAEGRAAAPLIAGSELYEIGQSPYAIALGGAAIGQTPLGSLFTDNPAAAASLLRKEFAMGFARHGNGRVSFDFSFLYPSDFGVFGVSFYGAYPISSTPQDSWGSFSSVTLHFSKRLSKVLDVGFNLALDYNMTEIAMLDATSLEPAGNQPAANLVSEQGIPVGVHFDLAVSVTPSVDAVSQAGFSFRRIRYGLALRDIGLISMAVAFPMSGATTGAILFAQTLDPLILGFGVDILTFAPADQTSFLAANRIPNKGFSMRLVSDFRFSYPLNLSIQGGLVNTFYLKSKKVPELAFILGSFYNPLADTYFPATLGLSALFSAPGVDFRFIFVALLETAANSNSNSNSNRYSPTGATFMLKLSVTFGYRDESAPDIDPSVFSGEGVIERGTFKRVRPNQ